MTTTPGPWGIRTNSASLSIMAGERTVCTIPWRTYESKPELADANARLIAAAPEMRFEIQTSLEDINTAIDNFRVWTHQQLVRHLMEVQRRQCALLAKIEGKE